MAPRKRTVTDETPLYVPPTTAVGYGGQAFTVGKMTIGASLRFSVLLTKWFQRGQETAALLRTIEDPAARAAALSDLTWFTLLPERELAELLALALSAPDAPVDAVWVAEHFDFVEAVDVLDAWASHNDLGAYIDRLGKLGTRVSQMMAALTPPQNGQATRTA